MIRIPFALAGAATAAWLLSTARFIHEPEHVKWLIAGAVMLPFVVLAEALARRTRPARTTKPPAQSSGYPYGRSKQ